MLTTLKRIALLTPSLFLGSCLEQTEYVDVRQSIQLYKDATFITMENEGVYADAMAVENGKILAVGSLSVVKKQLSGKRFDSISLNNLPVVHVFFEIHDHMVMASRTALIPDVQPFTTPSL